MFTDLVVFDAQLAQISQTCNFYLCLFGYAIAFFYAFVYTTSKLRKLHIEHVDQLPAELADLRRGTDEVVTQLYDEVARVHANNTDVFRKLKEEVNDLHADDNKFVVELRDQFTQLSQQNQAAEKLVTAAILRTRTLEAELDVLPAQLAGLRRGIHEVVTQLHDEVDRVQAANAQLHRELKDELIGREPRNDEIVAELREQVTRLKEQNDDVHQLITAASVKMRALETELDTQRQKHVELSDFARRAYIPPHAAVVAAAAKEERTRGNAAVMAEVVRLSQESVECKVTFVNEVVVTDQCFHQSHPVVPLILPHSIHGLGFLDCTTCLIVTSFRMFKNDRQHLDDALAYICEIADEPLDAFGIYRLFLKELFSVIRYYERPGYCATHAFGDICNRGFNFNELLFMIHVGDSGTRYNRLERKMRKVFRFLRLRANPPYGMPAEFMENRRLKEYCTGGLSGGPLTRF
jgi:phage host-nuclease inhibitor protein Gam